MESNWDLLGSSCCCVSYNLDSIRTTQEVIMFSKSSEEFLDSIKKVGAACKELIRVLNDFSHKHLETEVKFIDLNKKKVQHEEQAK